MNAPPPPAKPLRFLGHHRVAAIGLLVLLALVAAFLLPLGCHGRRVSATFVPNHDDDFDFSDPPCEPAARPDGGPDDVLVRYLGVSGLLIEWRGVQVMTAPFFSNPSPWHAAFGAADWDDEAIRDGLSGMDLDAVGAVLTGHSHYDHLSDLPPVLKEHAPGARLYVNRSGANILAAFPELSGRITVLNDHAGRWLRLEGADGALLPVRVLPIASGHADHYGFFHYAGGAVDEPWTTWQGHGLRDMKEGRTFTFLIDLLAEDGRTAFRIFHQDASAAPPLGLPPAAVIDERPVDLATLCMPSHWKADGYPEALVERLRARHRMAIHYEDFFRPRSAPLRFVALLGDARARDFLVGMRCGEEAPRDGSVAPDRCGCGPCGARCSMPLPGDWLRFSGSPESNYESLR